MKTLIVTGGIATGKSTAIRLLMKKGGPRLRLFDCDAEAGRPAWLSGTDSVRT